MVNAKITATLIGMVILMIMNYYAGTEQENGFSIMKTEYRNQFGHNTIQIFYPQIQGLGDGEKEECINVLIKKDAMRQAGGELYEENNLAHKLDYEIKFLNDEVFSICYEGFYGGTTSGSKLCPAVLTTTVDISAGKILTLNDVVTDFDKLGGMLLEDKFENITLWDGMKGDRRISQSYGQKEGLIRMLQDEEWDITGTNLGWYTDGEQFVIVLSKGITYDEFAIDILEAEDILDSGFLEMLDGTCVLMDGQERVHGK